MSRAKLESELNSLKKEYDKIGELMSTVNSQLNTVIKDEVASTFETLGGIDSPEAISYLLTHGELASFDSLSREDEIKHEYISNLLDIPFYYRNVVTKQHIPTFYNFGKMNVEITRALLKAIKPTKIKVDGMIGEYIMCNLNSYMLLITPDLEECMICDSYPYSNTLGYYTYSKTGLFTFNHELIDEKCDQLDNSEYDYDDDDDDN